MKKAVVFDIRQTELKEASWIDELQGKLGSNDDEDRLMRSVAQNDKQSIDNGKLIAEAINQGINSFTPDMAFDQMVKNYSIAEQIYGDSLIRLISGYNPDYIRKNIKIPEFQRELKQRIEKTIDKLKEEGLLDKDNSFTEAGNFLAGLVTYFEELDKINPHGIEGERVHKRGSIYGTKEDIKDFRRSDRYRDIAMKKSLKLAIRRNHKKIEFKDLKVFNRQSRGKTYIIFALDASGSMKGAKLGACKRAGIALAYKALEGRDKIGLIAFGSDIKEAVEPTSDFKLLLSSIMKIRASRQTDIAATVRKAAEMFPAEDVTKHLIIITDALPNIGKEPEKETIQEVCAAKDKGITISIIAIKPDSKAEELSKKIVEIGGGRLYSVRDVENVDKIVLEDYFRVS